jgi:hypothetical protein
MLLGILVHLDSRYSGSCPAASRTWSCSNSAASWPLMHWLTPRWQRSGCATNTLAGVPILLQVVMAAWTSGEEGDIS